MIWPVGETLKLIEPQLPGALISQAAFSPIQAIAAQLPDAMSSYLLECRLGANPSQVDLLACVSSVAGGPEILAGRNATTGLSPVLLEQPLWRRVRDFVSEWAEPGSSLYQQMPHIWLEFDIDPLPLPIPLPNLLLCLDAKYRRDPEYLTHDNLLNRQILQQVAQTMLAGLPDSALTLIMQKHLFTCFDRLPQGGHLVHLSAMLARQPAILKVNLSLPKRQLLAYLNNLGWTGASVELEMILATFYRASERVKFQLTLGTTIAPKVEFEFHFSTVRQDARRLQVLLGQLLAGGQCTSAQQIALAGWSGVMPALFTGQTWSTRFVRWVDVKLIAQPGLPLSAKGYLGFAPILAFF